ncbi:hypothetical protein [Palleronia sp. LCG004]|uniref:hypothetical protein n=1 Tax=Palleronia sp. LCG004 TaxID=3079304 RepID=UPI00294234AF|nr:hypothetical protein [Palleronia sp. LCG004]WOI56734.1 hypothetical protein RVY76_02765 [Palleronia sp. LCG004]
MADRMTPEDWNIPVADPAEWLPADAPREMRLQVLEPADKRGAPLLSRLLERRADA